MARRLPASVISFQKTGNFKYVKDGSGHRAGEKWGDAKNINPYSNQMRYSKNSPSFDTGVWWSKKKRKVADISRRLARGEKNISDSKFIPRPDDYRGSKIMGRIVR
jgi:hypothetical protein